jgi:acetoin utilization protein AcuC
VSRRVELIAYGDDAPLYDHGPQHPLRPARVLLTRRLIHDYGLIDGERVTETTARDATDDEIRLVHTEPYVDAVKRAGRGEPGDWWRFGFGPGDNPIFPNMHEASARVAGASIVAAEAVLTGRAEHAFNPAGGLHHAMPERASGFCVYDDPAIAIRWMLEGGVGRIAYVDVDVHHGDGPQAIFYRDPRVLTVSLHQDGRTLFPGTGFVPEYGAGEAEGTKANVPLPPYTGDRAWQAAFREIAVPLVRAWKPDVLVTQLGCDTHHTDPLAQFGLTTATYGVVARLLHELAHDAAGGRWVATGGGGYQWARVVPRAWTISFAEMAGVAVSDQLPQAWVEEAEREAGFAVPTTLSEPPVRELASNPAVDRVIETVRAVIFPRHGLTQRAP